MNKYIHILDYAISSLLQERMKNSVILFTYTLNVFLVVSILFLSDALFEEARLLLQKSPEIIVQNLKGGRHEMAPIQYMDVIQSIRGVQNVTPRHWGYYYDVPTETNYTFMGVDTFPSEIAQFIETEDSSHPELGKKGNFIQCIIGQGVADVRFIGPEDIIPILGSDGNLYVLKVTGLFKSESTILTNDVILIDSVSLQTIFDSSRQQCTDFAVSVRNEKEIDTIIQKIQERLPMVRIISRNQLMGTYRAIFGWRSGVAVTLLLGSILAFFVLVWDKASGISAQEQQNIGILKAIGWSTSDVLTLRFWEGFVISSLSVLSGILLAYLHVFYFGGTLFRPIIQGWSVLFPYFNPMPHVDLYKMGVVLCITVLPYIAAILIPSWKSAIKDPDEVMR
jgi:ABC-type lipoprotein release transport system permease subunit